MIKNTALVLEGGGSRGMFSAGILEVFLENDLCFESVYGVSAGAYNAASYIAKQAGRNLAINEYIGDKRYRGINNLIRTGSLFGWDFIFTELANHLLPFDFDGMRNSPSKFYVGVSNCHTGKSEFIAINSLPKSDIKSLMIATGSLPLIAPIEYYNNIPYLDGGLADSIPFEYALSNGSDRAVVVLTQPKGYQKNPLKFKTLFKILYRKHPKVYDMLLQRADNYNASLKQLEQFEKEGRVYVIRPKNTLEVSRIESKPHKTAIVYAESMDFAKGEFEQLQKWLGQ